MAEGKNKTENNLSSPLDYWLSKSDSPKHPCISSAMFQSSYH